MKERKTLPTQARSFHQWPGLAWEISKNWPRPMVKPGGAFSKR